MSYYFDVGPERDFMFEAHLYLFEPIRFPLDYEGLWRRSAASDFDGAPCRRLAPEDHYVHIVFHAALERLDPSDKALQDLELLVRHGDVDLDLVMERAREWRTTRAVWLLTKLVDASAPELGLERIVRALAPPRAVTRGAGAHRPSRPHGDPPFASQPPFAGGHPLADDLSTARSRWRAW